MSNFTRLIKLLIPTQFGCWNDIGIYRGSSRQESERRECGVEVFRERRPAAKGIIREKPGVIYLTVPITRRPLPIRNQLQINIRKYITHSFSVILIWCIFVYLGIGCNELFSSSSLVFAL